MKANHLTELPWKAEGFFGKRRNGVAVVRKTRMMFFLSALLIFGAVACKPDDGIKKLTPADPNLETKIEKFTPDSGGIATQMLIKGENFGNDTSKIKVYFKKDETTRVPASIISCNGRYIYLVVPKLTYMEQLQVEVEVKAGNDTRVKTFDKPFHYKTQTSVTTVAGTPFQSTNDAVTKPGPLSTSTFSAPMYLCVDDEKNLIVIERAFQKNAPEMDFFLSPKLEDKKGKSGIISMLNEKAKEVVILKDGAGVVNAPTVTADGRNIYVPFDDGVDFWEMRKEENYSPRQRRIKANSTLTASNWKFSFVTMPLDDSDPNMEERNFIYTIMYNGQLLRIHRVTGEIKVLSNDVKVAPGQKGSDTYLSFNPRDKLLYISATNSHSVWRIDVTDPARFSSDSTAQLYAGLGQGVAGRGWAEGSLRDARFNFPRQLIFDGDGVLYLADSRNHCIRQIDTRLGGNATVKTLIGFPGDEGRGSNDGGPDVARFNTPMGIAIANKKNGSTIYIADTQNFLIRKLEVQ